MRTAFSPDADAGIIMGLELLADPLLPDANTIALPSGVQAGCADARSSDVSSLGSPLAADLSSSGSR